jgi:hypothetical protein
MAITVKHKFVSAIPDAGDPTIVQPSNWNDDHDLTGTIPVANGGTGASTANGALTNLLPSQTGNSGKVLSTDGTNTSWTAAGGSGTVTSVATGTGLTGGPITTSGTISIDSTVATLTGTQTLTNKTLTGPKIDLINDTNGNEILGLSPTTSATDYLTVKNGIGVGVPLHVYADGSSTNVGLHIQPKGTGLVTISDGTDFNKGIRFRSSSSAASAITLLDAVATAGRVVTLPDATTTLVGRDTTDTLTNKSISGTTNTLSNIGNSSLTNSAITINGTSVSLGGSTTITASAGGSTTQLQYNNAGSFGGVPLLTYNGITLAMTGGTIDNTVIGGTTPAAGTFTTLTSSGTATLANGSTTYVTVTGDASYPMIKATGGTNTPLVLSPLGTGALQAQKTDSTATGGNARGANAVDWQTARDTAAKVASGQYSVISGGVFNRSSQYGGFVGGGENNTASGYDSVAVGGQSSTASSTYAFVGGGTSNTASGYGAAVLAGYTNTAAGYFNFVGNGYTNSGTSGSAVTTQSGTMNGTTAVTLSGSNASIKVGQLITGTSINNFPNTYVAAISGTSLTLSQVASGSSTSTLSFFTPHGVVVGGGNNQATGSYSFIGGGGDAGTSSNRNVASGAWSTIGGGNRNTASGLGSFIGGNGGDGAAFYPNTASGVSSAIVCGTNNTLSSLAGFIGAGISHNNTGAYGFIGAGSQNTVNGFGSAIVGGYNGNTRSITGNQVFPACVSPIANATATILRSESGAAGTTNQVILPNNSAYYFKASIISGVTGGGNSKSWTIEGLIKRGANAASAALVGTPVVNTIAQDAGASTWAITATADTTNGGLAITFTGQASTTIRTVCKVETTEMTY